MGETKHSGLKNFLNYFECYAATICFIAITILLTIQVITRYVLGHSFTWVEEASTLLFVWMVYFGIAGATLARKHLGIEFLLGLVSFKTKRALLILNNCIFAFFNIFIMFPLYKLIRQLGHSVTTLLKIPKQLVYVMIPLMFILTTIRLVQDTWKLLHESEKNLGASKPTLDLQSYEREYKESVAARGGKAE